MEIKIVPVTNRRQMSQFIDFPIDLYKDCPYYVPELKFDLRATLNPKKNPAFEFSEAQPFLAYLDGKVAGRIVALINHKANNKWGVKDVRFGWIDFIDNYEVFEALMDAARDWGKERGMNRLHGPLGFMDTDREGLLIEGFDRICTMALAYSYPYYKDHFDRYGMEKGTDWYESRIFLPTEWPEKYARLAGAVAERFHLHVEVEKNKRRLKNKTAYEYFELIDKCYSGLYGYTENTPAQIKKLINDYIGFADLDLLPTVRDEEGNLVMVGLLIPSIAKALIECRGSLFPLGWWKIIKRLYIKHDDTVELLLVAIDPKWQGKGVQAVIFTYLFPMLLKKGFKYAETNANLEDNHKIRNIWNAFDHETVKKRRAYVKNI